MFTSLYSKLDSKNLVNYNQPMQTQNLNIAIDNIGLRRYSIDAVGIPTNNGGVVFTMLSADNQGVQIAKANNQKFLNVRWYNADTWSEWMMFSVTTQ